MDPLELIVNGKRVYFNQGEQMNSLIRDRSQQNKFRNAIIARDQRCIVTDIGFIVCEACHIVPFSSGSDSENFDPNNGILLECGLHKLFDMYCMSIDPTTSTVHFNKKILDDPDYEQLHRYENKQVNLSEKTKKYLRKHYDHFTLSNFY